MEDMKKSLDGTRTNFERLKAMNQRQLALFLDGTERDAAEYGVFGRDCWMRWFNEKEVEVFEISK